MAARLKAKYLALFAFSFWAAMATARAEHRVALVIGNAAYQNTAPLGNPINDAEDIAAALERVGFTIQLERDLTKRGMENALARFARLAEGADAAMVFYAGHGIQYRGTNYLMPVDARVEDEVSINYELMRIDDVVFSLERARGVKLLVLDACRNNPLLDRLLRRTTTRDVPVSRGLARIDPARGMVIAFATQADQVAVDGTGRNSPFTSALVRYIGEPGLEVGALFRRVAIEVDRATNGRQLPELSVSLRGEFFLNQGETDMQMWSRIRASEDTKDLSDFLRLFPASTLVPDARQRLEAIGRAQAAREKADSERAEQERFAREKAVRDREERERIARDQMEREQLARQTAAREQAVLEAAARELAERELRTREQAERERLAREQAAREQQTARPAASPQIAMLPPPSTAPPAPAGAVLVRQIKVELKRVGCLSGLIDEKWTSAETRSALKKFTRFAKLQSTPDEPSADLLDAVRRSTARICPLECSPRQLEKDGVCVTKVCPPGHRLDGGGHCVASAKPKPARQAVQPRSSGRRCFNLGGQSFCE